MDSKLLLKRIDKGFQLLENSPEEAFRESKTIEMEARNLNIHEAELPAIVIQCIYYRGKNDFKEMMTRAKLLQKKAEMYEEVPYQIMAKRYLFEAYFFSGLPKRALEELERGLEIANGLTREDSLSLVSRGNMSIAMSNFYAREGDYREQLKFLHRAGREFEKMPNKVYRKKLLYIHYANLAAAYNEINKLDSAKYFTGLSQSLNEHLLQDNTNNTNLWVLGSVAMKEYDYKKALRYFKEAEKMEGYKNHLNIENLYNNIILSYTELKKLDSARIYELKKDSLKLRITENQNRSLQNLLNERSENRFPYVYVITSFFLIFAGILFVVLRKNKIYRQQEQESRKYLEKLPGTRISRNYTQLLQLLEEGDPSYMNYFDEMFPDFAKKLLAINPQIVQSEIEFCSLLKLKIPTKDIARYKYITPKTVQNKKYLIRKKLDIPKDVDIYQWFDSF
ncbi:hypothetical protein QRD02_12030 [Aequorivita sp. SDUM287046]|uniref:Tetratricopeptide repeat protein n=1 Tax=Aequorivita aurantiaca TaxID=3053356 RepID=A0ABT8DI88_9FLAO|nr:hypothetical protein [Aequorivita aurantiaca]MDN3725115.1 hypothetical protein [Aequorivita aurantiaca]